MLEENQNQFTLKYCNICGAKIPDVLDENYIENKIQNFYCMECGRNLTEDNKERLNLTIRIITAKK